MSVNWIELMNSVDNCGSVKDIEGLMIECGVNKLDVFGYLKKCVRKYSYDRDYRERRNMSIKSVKSENDELRSLSFGGVESSIGTIWRFWSDFPTFGY